MTGLLQTGDRVRTEHGDGTILHAYTTTDWRGPTGWHVVERDDGERLMYRTDQLEFISRQLALDDSEPDNP